MLYTVCILSLVALSTVFWLPTSANGSISSAALVVEAIPSPPAIPLPLPLPHHIFNAIHSSARQWGESLNHNGMSFFLATVPRGTVLHHGTHSPAPVAGMEWLAFEPEHALLFAWKICDNTTSDLGLDAVVRESHARSLHGWYDFLDAVDYERLELRARRQGRPPRCFEPGFIHTYSARRPLNLLYLDGQSAAKSDKGTDDSQDYVLRHNISPEKPPGRGRLFGDLDRAIDLCHMAQHDYNGRVDGYLRMEHGFEIILCDFSSLDVVSISRAQTVGHEADLNPDDQVLQDEALMLMSAVAARYDGVGTDRVLINYDDFVTSFAYPDADLWAGGGELPRLNGTKAETLAKIKDDRCTTAYIPHHLLSVPPHQQTLAHRTVLAVARDLCTVLWDVMDPNNNGGDSEKTTTQHDYDRAIAAIESLITRLAWTEWKKCSPPPACAADEVCFTAIWPYGSQQDHDRPTCKNATTIMDHRQSMGYWFKGPPPT
ncbi:hypothetical protein DV735_g4753, partial [Chaetothyriales sp. CBS 134920]